ncbi:MAG TPA: selenocysteine-specific translation elongation factor, partial [Patescibacteria group bacterium]|nr:selenocysteine-specific translation elongation factor [Patescibacteria group bacterium]
MGFVVGTAGHIDHGKSTLIHALTGIDPDRLAEEKRRGMTIDLGFAHMSLPSGREIGIVDVPGHARFIRNMLAGAQGIDAVLLIVAADEGVMPQTREHLDIVDLLEIRRGIAVLTKTDLVDAEWLELVTAELAAALRGTAMHGAPVIGVSATTGKGVPELVAAMDELLESAVPRPDLDRPRLPIDRVFTMSGFGTVVTGTLAGGTLSTGDELEVVPGGRPVRVRGLQRHNRKVASAQPGDRVAANLIGIDKAELARGDVVARPGTVETTRRVDARIRSVASLARPLRHGDELLLHVGTAEVACRLIMLSGDELPPGAEGWVQLYLERPIAAEVHDRVVLRLPSPAVTVGGGTIVDVTPRKHSRHDSAVRESLIRREAGDVLQEELRKYPRGVTVSALLKATQSPAADIGRLNARRLGDWIFSHEAWLDLSARATRELEAFHAAHPLRPGMFREELRSRLGAQPGAYGAIVQGLIDDGRVVESDGALAAAGHRPVLEAPAGPARALLEL